MQPVIVLDFLTSFYCLEQLDEIFVTMAIRDEEGQRFWLDNFPKQVIRI